MDGYEIVTNIGKGSSGAVYLARSYKTKRPVAIKKILIEESRRSKCRKSVIREANIMLSLDHCHVVKCYEWFMDCQNENISMVLEFCNGGTLQDKIMNTKLSRSNISEDQIGKWTTQITSAVDYIHQRRILHRDLKSENVFLLKDDTVKLGDFGISKDLNHTLDKANTCVGTPCYLSPELCKDIPYSFKSDVWALGCLVYEMSALKPAFDAANLISLFHKIVNCKFDEIPAHCSPQLRLFISSILVADAAQRPTAARLLESAFVRPFRHHVMRTESAAGDQQRPAGRESLSAREADWSQLDDDLDALLHDYEDDKGEETAKEEDEADDEPLLDDLSSSAVTWRKSTAGVDAMQRSANFSSDSEDDDFLTDDDDNDGKRQSERKKRQIDVGDFNSSTDSDSTFENSTLNNSTGLNSSKGLEEEIPEVIEVVDESGGSSSTAVASSAMASGFGTKLAGSVWLQSKRAQALRQRNVAPAPTKIITGVQRQKQQPTTATNALSQSIDVSNMARANEQLKPKRTASLGSDKSEPLPTAAASSKTSPVQQQQPTARRRVRPLVQKSETSTVTTAEVNIRDLPGSAWLYGKAKKKAADQDSEVYVDDFEDDDYDDDDFEEEVDECSVAVNSPAKTSISSIELVKQDCIDSIGLEEYEKLCSMIRQGCTLSSIYERCKERINYETLETCFLIMK